MDTKCFSPLFLERLQRIYPQRLYASMLRLFSAERPTAFRVNTAQPHAEEVPRALCQAGLSAQRLSWYPDAYVLTKGTLRQLTETSAYQEGRLYVQRLSSMLPPLCLELHSGQTVLDLTAAPGSKTTQMAALIQNQGRIVANDNNRPRFFRLMANVRQQQATSVECLCSYGETFWRRFPGQFDRVLMDAPCSAEGRFSTRDPKTYRYWKLRKIREMVRKQRRLLFSAIHCLKPGGLLVYSTCTFAPEENEGVVSWALQRFADTVELVPCEIPVPNRMRALTAWDDQPFHPSMRRATRIIPTTTMDAFFLAKLRKRSTGPSQGQV